MDLSNLTAEQLQAELKRRQDEKKSKREDFKNLTNEVIPALFERLKKVSESLQEAKVSIFEDIKALTELKIEAYDARPNQQSHTFTTEDGERITIGYNVNVSYDDSVYVGVAKVKEFINSQIKDDLTAKLVNQINRLLRPDNKGNLDPKRVLELKKMANEFNNLDFIEGVEIIENAYQPRRSSWYIKASYRDKSGLDRNLPLSISSVEFNREVDLSILLPDDE